MKARFCFKYFATLKLHFVHDFCAKTSKSLPLVIKFDVSIDAITQNIQVICLFNPLAEKADYRF